VTPPEQQVVALELERLRGSVDTGFARLNGRLDVSLQRTDQAEKDIGDLEQRVSSLERSRWPLPSVGVLTGGAGFVLALYQLADGG
jgi:hypothetical protein